MLLNGKQNKRLLLPGFASNSAVAVSISGCGVAEAPLTTTGNFGVGVDCLTDGVVHPD